MVIEDHDRLTCPEQIRFVDDGWTVTVDHHEHGTVIHHLQRLRTGDEHILRIVSALQEALLQRQNRCRHRIFDDVAALSEFRHHPIYTGGRTEAVHIAVRMAHDEHAVPCFQELLEGLCLHTRLHSGCLLLRLRLPTEVGQIFV